VNSFQAVFVSSRVIATRYATPGVSVGSALELASPSAGTVPCVTGEASD
jgi:hypothetical protein